VHDKLQLINKDLVIKTLQGEKKRTF
jgi:hypothetical protein